MFQEIFDNACNKDSRPGKYRPYVEYIRRNVYSIYCQTEDSPFGDVWELWFVKVEKESVEVIRKIIKNNDFYYEGLPHEEFRKIPLGDVYL